MGPPTGVDMAVSSFFSSLGRCQFGNQWARSPATPTVNYSRMVNCCCCPCLAQIIGAAISYRGGGGDQQSQLAIYGYKLPCSGTQVVEYLFCCLFWPARTGIGDNNASSSDGRKRYKLWPSTMARRFETTRRFTISQSGGLVNSHRCSVAPSYEPISSK